MSNKVVKLNNVQKPVRMWIDGKCFNIRKHKQKNTEANESPEHEHFNVMPHENGKLITSFRLPSAYYYKINTNTKFTLRELEIKTQTLISIPTLKNNEHVTIIGEDELKIAEARHTMHSFISDIRDSTAAMQFISIPVLSDEIKDNFKKFRDEILSGDPIKGVEESIFQSPLKLHLTIVVFALMDDFERNHAVKALNDYKTAILDPLIENAGPLKIVVSGIECMNDNYSKVDVLYANAKIVNENEELNLQKIANDLSDHFYERGLVRKYQDNVKLHVTLINTKYRKPPSNQSTPEKKRRKWVKRQPFDARPIMEKYKDYHFGECNFDAIHLSLISSKGEDGFYKPLSIIKVS